MGSVHDVEERDGAAENRLNRLLRLHMLEFADNAVVGDPELELRRVERQGVLQPSEIVINVLPDNRDSAAAMQLHVENGAAVDLTLGQGTLLEYPAPANGNASAFISRLADITSAVASGKFQETVTKRAGRVGRAKGVIKTRSGVIKGSTHDLTAGWLFAKRETINYAPYAAGIVRVKEGAPIVLP